MSDEDVIRRRLLIDGDGTGDDRRLNTLIKSLVKWTNSKKLTEEEDTAMYERIMSQLAQCEFPAHRAIKLNDTNKHQVEDYNQMEQEIEDNIVKVKNTIEDNKAKLEEAKKLKGHRMQYDLLAKSIQEQPTRAVTEKKLASIRSELDVLKDEKKTVDGLMDQRRKQFSVLSSSANQIRTLLEKEKMAQSVNTSLDDITNSPGPEPMSE